MPDEDLSEHTSDLNGLAPDELPTETLAGEAGGRIFSVYGIVSAVLGVVSVAAIALGVVIWSAHRDDVRERAYQSSVLRAAAGWTTVLVNMNTDNVDASLQRLRDKTVGQLNADFDSAIAPYRQLVQKLQSRSVGQIESVAIESMHHDPDAQPRAAAEQLPPGVASRTDTVLVVATSVAENPGDKTKIVHWNLRLDVSDVDGTPRISRLESIR